MYFWTSKNSLEVLSFSKEAFPNNIFSMLISKPKLLMPRNSCVLCSVYIYYILIRTFAMVNTLVFKKIGQNKAFKSTIEKQQ